MHQRGTAQTEKSLYTTRCFMISQLVHTFCHCPPGRSSPVRSDGELSGRNGLPELAKGTARDQEWKHLGHEEQERLLQQLRDFKAEKALTKVAKVSPEFTANDIETTIRRMNTEVSQTQHRALCVNLPGAV